MSWLSVEKALIKSFTSMALGYPIIQENEKEIAIKKAQGNDHWFEVFNIPADSEPLDKNLTDKYSGIFQINVNSKQNKGKGNALALVDQIVAHYVNGAEFTEDTCVIYIEIASQEPALNSGSYFTIPVSVRWFSFIGR